MQASMMKFVTGVTTDIAYWIYTDPVSSYDIVKSIGGPLGITIPTSWGPNRRTEPFFRYNFKLNPHLMVTRSPSEQGAMVMQFVRELVIPLLPMLQQEGITLDWEAFFKMISRYMQIPEFNHIITYSNEELVEPRRMDSGRMPAETTRNYVRENRPAATRQGQDEVLIRQLMGADSQPSEMASLLRPVS
jgi:hypothetical protein